MNTSSRFNFRAMPALIRLAQREREVRDTLWLLLSIGWLLLPHLFNLPLWASTSIVVLLAWRTWLTWQGKRLPRQIWLIALMCGAAFAVFAQYRTIFGKDAGVAFLILLLGLKLLEMRARRDIFIVIFLGLFVMLTSFFESQTIVTALMMLVSVLLLMTALVSANFIAHEPPYRIKLKLAAQLCLYALPLMATLFLLFPRIQGPLWGMPNDVYSSKTGLSDSMSPGSFGNLIESDEVALRAKFSGRIPTPAERYWRGPVFGSFDGRTWRPSMQGFSGAPASVQLQVDATSLLDYTVTQEATHRPWLLVLDVPQAVPQLDAGTHSDTSARLLDDLVVLAQTPMQERLRYHAQSYTRYRLAGDENPARLLRWLDLPYGYNPRTLAFASQVRGLAMQRLRQDAKPIDNATIQRQSIEQVLRYIRTENFVYTTQPPALGRDSVDEFLFDTRRGFCEHYASAFVVLMRMLGIPARVVTGYQGGVVNPVDGYMEVRQRDAHAWAEVWLQGQGWVRIDPTAAVAPERIERGAQAAFDPNEGFTGELLRRAGWLTNWQRQMRFNLDAIGNAWNQWVLGYGSERQSSLLSSFGIEKIDWQGLTIALISVFGLLLAIIGVRLIGRRAKPDPVVQLYDELCRRVSLLAGAKQAGQRQPHEGPQTYLARLRSTLPEALRTRVEEAFTMYEQLRYQDGSPAATHDNFSLRIERFKTCIQKLRL